jgi:hypothetical protein
MAKQRMAHLDRELPIAAGRRPIASVRKPGPAGRVGQTVVA